MSFSRQTGERLERTFTRRSAALMLAQAAVFGGLGMRLYQMQVLEAAETGALAEGNRTRRMLLAPRRGRILDAAGNVLADNAENFRAVLLPRTKLDAGLLRAELKRLAPVLHLSEDEQERLILVAGRYGHERTLVLATGLTFEQVAALEVRSLEFPFVTAQVTSTRAYAVSPRPASMAMAHIIGTVGAAANLGLDDDPVLRLTEMRVGKTGVEAGMEHELRGRAGEAVMEVDARGRTLRQLKQTAPRAGRDVLLSIDSALQSRFVERLAAERGQGAIVALDIATGEVKAMASLPAYDPASLSGPGSEAAWRLLTADNERPLVNRAIAGVYPPGSTFKLVTALAALRAGTIEPKEKIECWGDVTYAGHVFRCWNRKGHKASDLHKALRESCDCYFYEAARRTGIDRIAAMAHELGLGETYKAGIARQQAGLIPTTGWKRLQGRTGWLIGETLLAGIGQGYVLATPLQLAVMTARVASGRAVVPTLIKRSGLEPAAEFAPLGVPDAALGAVRSGMVAVVNEPGGTGQQADLDDPHLTVAGKSGTSQVSRLSAERELKRALAFGARDHAVFVAYAPAAAPRYAVAVLLEHAGGGGAKAAPVARDCLKILFESDRLGARPSAAAPANGDVPAAAAAQPRGPG